MYLFLSQADTTWTLFICHRRQRLYTSQPCSLEFRGPYVRTIICRNLSSAVLCIFRTLLYFVCMYVCMYVCMFIYESIMYDVCMYESIYTEVCAQIYANLTLIPLLGLAAWQVRVDPDGAELLAYLNLIQDISPERGRTVIVVIIDPDKDISMINRRTEILHGIFINAYPHTFIPTQLYSYIYTYTVRVRTSYLLRSHCRCLGTILSYGRQPLPPSRSR